MDGQMGEPPDWWKLMQAARYLGVAPWDLMKQSVWWVEKATIARAAEIQAQKIIDEHR